MSKRPYIKPGRLADVLALIQVLAFDPDAHRSELGIINREIGPPSSSDGWTTLAKEHRELFRVSDDAKRPLSLVARHVQPRNPEDKREPLSPEFTQVLIKTAIELHDRQVAASEKWKNFFTPILTGAILVLLTSICTLYLTKPPKPSGRFAPAKDFGINVLLDTESGQLCHIEGFTNSPTVPTPSCNDLR